jgi:hypothetical protein
MGGPYARRVVFRGALEKQITRLAFEALDENDLKEIMQLVGSETALVGEASAALRILLAERITDYAIRAMSEARKRRIGMGAAAMIIGSR